MHSHSFSLYFEIETRSHHLIQFIHQNDNYSSANALRCVAQKKRISILYILIILGARKQFPNVRVRIRYIAFSYFISYVNAKQEKGIEFLFIGLGNCDH